jgi:hypothetical protein
LIADVPAFARRCAVLYGAWVVLGGIAGNAQTSTSVHLPDAPQAQQADQSAPGKGSTPTPESPEEKRRRAQEELKKEEHQRILGVVPNFGTTDLQNAAPLSPKQKIELDLHSSIDPFVFVAAGLDAAEEQGDDTFPEYGQGAEGYGKRFGASYADTFDGNLWGNAVLPILLHEDPRYFRKGTGSILHRLLYSAATNVWSKRDNGRWGPNYANIGGNFIAGGISNLYYPASDRGLELTVERALTVTAEGGAGSEFVEFWPDISRHLFHRRNALPPAEQESPPATKPVDQTNGTTTPKPQ